MLKRCSICLKDKPKTKEFWYYHKQRNTPSNSSCKPCTIQKNWEYKKNKRKQGIPYWDTKACLKRRLQRAKTRANNLKISLSDYLEYKYKKKLINKKKKKLKTLITKLNTHKLNSTDPIFLKQRYQISDCEYKQLTKDMPNEKALINRIRYKYDATYNLKVRLRNQIKKKAKLYPNIDVALRNCLNNKQNKTKYEKILGYSIQELKQHLEKKFEHGMSWKEFNSGNIHIDHIKPQKLFDMNDVEQVIKCWSLNNLQPLWARDNLSKKDRYIKCGSLS